MLDRGNAEDDWAPNLDEPTFPLRMRALCNTVKRQLLGDSHDPWRAQADDVIAAPGTPVKSATTWLAWWRGQSSPQTAKLRAFERVSPGSSRWLQSSHYGSPIQRHLAALEVMALEAPSKGDWVELKTQRSAALLSKCHEAWSLLTSETAVPR